MQITKWMSERLMESWAHLVFLGALPFVPLNATLPEWSKAAGALAVGIGLLVCGWTKREFALPILVAVFVTHQIPRLARTGGLILVLAWMVAVSRDSDAA